MYNPQGRNQDFCFFFTGTRGEGTKKNEKCIKTTKLIFNHSRSRRIFLVYNFINKVQSSI